MNRIIWKATGLAILLGSSAVIGYDVATIVTGIF
jgi:hypothetical protein